MLSIPRSACFAVCCECALYCELPFMKTIPAGLFFSNCGPVISELSRNLVEFGSLCIRTASRLERQSTGHFAYRDPELSLLVMRS